MISLSDHKWTCSTKYIYLLTFIVLSLNMYAKTENQTNDSTEYPWPRFSLTAGGFYTELNNQIFVASDQLGIGATIDIEDALGLEARNLVFRGELEYSFGKHNKSQVSFGYFGFFRNAKKNLQKEIEIGENTFPIGSTIVSKFNMQILKTTYHYNYFMDERVKLGASIGFFVTPVSFSVSSASLSQTAFDFTAPLPLIGLDAAVAINPKVLLKQSIEILYISTPAFKGQINDINICVEYNPWKHFGLGLGYNYFQLALETPVGKNSGLDFTGKMISNYTGLMFYGKYFF